MSIAISWSNFRLCSLWLQSCYQPSYRHEGLRQRKFAAIQKALFLQHVTPLYIFTLSLHFSGVSSLPCVFQATGIAYANILAKEFVLAAAVLRSSCSLGIGPRDECCKSERGQNLENYQLIFAFASWFTFSMKLRSYYLALRGIVAIISFASSLHSSDSYYTTILLLFFI